MPYPEPVKEVNDEKAREVDQKPVKEFDHEQIKEVDKSAEINFRDGTILDKYEIFCKNVSYSVIE